MNDNEWEIIGKDLRGYNGKGPVVSCFRIRRAMGLNTGKLPLHAVHLQVIGDTYVYVLGRVSAIELKPGSHRPHRMFAICNHCGKHVPTGRFGQHLNIHKPVDSRIQHNQVMSSLVP